MWKTPNRKSGHILLLISCCLIVLPVLKKYYARLCQCLPQDCVKTVDKLKQIISAGISANALDRLKELPTTEQTNETIVAFLMQEIAINGNVISFCDNMEYLSDQNALVASFRNGKL